MGFINQQTSRLGTHIVDVFLGYTLHLSRIFPCYFWCHAKSPPKKGPMVTPTFPKTSWQRGNVTFYTGIDNNMMGITM